MPLSSAFNPNKPPNIKDVTWTPEKKSEKIFDPERDITEEDWKGMVGWFNEARQYGNWLNFSIYAFELLTLFPERREELRLGEVEFEGMLKELNKSRTPKERYFFSYRAFFICILFPDRRTELHLAENDFEDVIAFFNQFRENGQWEELFPYAIHLLSLFPDRHEELPLGDIEFQGIQRLNLARQHGEWYNFSVRATQLLTIFPESREELRLGDVEFEGMFNLLNQLRKSGSWKAFCSLAANLKILLADEIKRKPDGTLDIIFNKPKPTELKEETPPLPVTRNY